MVLLHWRVLPLLRCVLFLALAGTGIWGCQSGPRDGFSPAPAACSHASDHYPSVEKPVADVLAAALETNAAVPPTCQHPLQILVISGGVDGASHAAGVLVGWSKTGTRPTLDVVTGVSSGALLGLYAFLGSKYDADLQRLAS